MDGAGALWMWLVLCGSVSTSVSHCMGVSLTDRWSVFSSLAMKENLQNQIDTQSVEDVNNEYHEELLKNQQAESLVENTSKDEESSFTQEAFGDSANEHEIKNDLKEFGVDSDAPDLFSSENETSSTENLLSQENEDEEDDLEIPAFLRRQKN